MEFKFKFEIVWIKNLLSIDLEETMPEGIIQEETFLLDKRKPFFERLSDKTDPFCYPDSTLQIWKELLLDFPSRTNFGFLIWKDSLNLGIFINWFLFSEVLDLYLTCWKTRLLSQKIFFNFDFVTRIKVFFKI